MELAGLAEALDPNSTYRIDTSFEGGEENDIKKVSGDPLAVAKTVKQEAIKQMGSDEFVSVFELDKDTYYILTGEESITVIGKPRSPKYGGFWSSPDGEYIDQMDSDSMDARKV